MISVLGVRAVRVVGIWPIRVVGVMPDLVVEMIPDLAEAAANTTRIKMIVKVINLTFFIVLLLVT